MTAKKRLDRRFLIPAVGIALVLLLVLLRPVSLAQPEAQSPVQDRWVGYYMVYRPIDDHDFDRDWETYGDTKILNAQRQNDGRYAFTDLDGQALFFDFLPSTDPEDPSSVIIAHQSDAANTDIRSHITDSETTESLSGTLYFGPASSSSISDQDCIWTACLVYQRADGSLYLTKGYSYQSDGVTLKQETKYTSTINGCTTQDVLSVELAIERIPRIASCTFFQLDENGTLLNETTLSEAEALALTDGSYQLPLVEGTACILIRQDEERDGQTYTTLTPQPDGSFTGELWFLDERGIGVQIIIQTISE
ncbi:hypothetical protein [Flavonifractor porci]|uniref:hypothetical protein n=1 Tax=Flavonifractor porci TaxID=3133422 RepID=UPI0030AD3339